LQSGAYVIFDDDEPVGTPQDQLFRSSDASSQNASGVDHVSADGPDANEQDRDTDPV
jgi:hypothetical protein